METIESRRVPSTNTGRRRTLTVDILGRGSENCSVTPKTTVGDIRRSQGIGSNVRAVDSSGNRLEDNDTLDGVEELNFVPNVKGGK